MNRSTQSEDQHGGEDGSGNDSPQCRVVIDACPHSESLEVDFGEVKSSLSDLSSEITVFESLCKAPRRLREIVKDSPKGIVIVGYGDGWHTSRYRYADEVPPNCIEVIDLRLINAYRGNYDAFRFTVRLHMVKATHAADIQLQPRHKPFRLSDTVSRRNFFRAATTTLAEYPETPTYQRQLCAPYLEYCTHCIDACPYEAVRKNSGITIDDDLCTICGACSSDCPTGALQLPQFSDNQMVAILGVASSGDGDHKYRILLLTCNQGIEAIVKQSDGVSLPQSVGVVQIPCVAALGFLHYILAASFNTDLLALCPNNLCKKREALTLSRSGVAMVKNILTEVKKTALTVGLIEARGEEDATQLLKRTLAFKPPVDSRVPVLDRSSRRRLLITALSEASPGVKGRFEGDASPFCDVSIDIDRCTMCGACSRICPEDAISYVEGESAIDLVFKPGRCVVCYGCVRVCPEDCLHIEKNFSPSELIEDVEDVKVRDRAAICVRCGANMGPARKIQRVEDLLAAQGMQYLQDRLHLCSRCKSPI